MQIRIIHEGEPTESLAIFTELTKDKDAHFHQRCST